MKKDGTLIDVEVITDSIHFDGRPARLLLANDITERLRNEQELGHTNRALKMLSACNEAMFQAEEEGVLLDEICRIAVETGGYRMAWVGYARDDEQKSVIPMARAGHDEGYLAGNAITWKEESEQGRGPSGRVIRSGEPVVVDDLAADPSFAPWLDAAQARGYRGAIILPLPDKTRVFGVLGLYSPELLKSSAEEIEFLRKLADQLAFGVLSLRARKEKREADVRLREQATLLDQANEAIMVRDLDGTIIYWNRGAEKTYGWSAEEALGKKSFELLAEDAVKFQESQASVLAAGDWEGEKHQHTKDQREITVEARLSVVRDASGTPKSILSLNSDITEKKQLEAQFLRMQRMESIGTLAGGVAHDLNNVLAPIMMAIDALKDMTSQPMVTALLETISASAHHGADLVRQVLVFARGVEGERIPVNIGHLVHDIQKIIIDTFPKNINFRASPTRGIWAVIGDPTQLNQVFTNLCVNARDAMPQGGDLNITVENVVLDEVYTGMNRDAGPGNYVMVKVSDTGIGIPAEIRDRIFEPFFTTKEIGKGTGLGLSTTMAIVKSHGGFIHLYSEPGKGATFKVYLPAGTDAECPQAMAAEPPALIRGNGELIMVVDDEESVRTVARTALERFGYRILLAANGAQALGIYANYREEVALVITDMSMPLMDGVATAVALREINPNVKIIGSSGLETNASLARTPGLGINHFIAKPYTAETILRIIAEALGKK